MKTITPKERALIEKAKELSKIYQYGTPEFVKLLDFMEREYDEQQAQLSALHAAVAQAREAVQTARHWLFEVGASKEYSRELVETYLNMIDNELKKAG
jgi:ABC-type transporter Mla subunit MlaD